MPNTVVVGTTIIMVAGIINMVVVATPPGRRSSAGSSALASVPRSPRTGIMRRRRHRYITGRRRPITTHRHRRFITATEPLAYWAIPAVAYPDNALPHREQRQTEERFDEDYSVEPTRFCSRCCAAGAARRGAGATDAVSRTGRRILADDIPAR